MDQVRQLAERAGIETDGLPGGQLVRSRDADAFLDAVAAAGLGVHGFDVFRVGPRGLQLGPGGTASFGGASSINNYIELSRSILAEYAADPDAWIDFTLTED